MSDVLEAIEGLIEKDPESPVSKVLAQAVEKARANKIDEDKASAWDLYMQALSHLSPRPVNSADPRVQQLRKTYGLQP
jgi:hypothetical protein